MHPNPVFHTQDAQSNLAFAAKRAFGILAVNGPDGPFLSHIPFLVMEGDVLLHLVRSNPIARLLKTGSVPACIAVEGPDSYISPDWYGVPDQVPTWNYVAVHLHGPLSLLPDADLKSILDRESAFFEGRLQPKKPWTSDKMSDGVMDKMMRAIVPCRLQIEDIAGTWKLGQNKPEAARHGAADGVEETGIGTGLTELAELMRNA